MTALIIPPIGLPALTVSDWTERIPPGSVLRADLEMRLLRLCSRTDGPRSAVRLSWIM